MSEIEYLDLPPEQGGIHEVFIWIGIHAAGREAMMSADMPTPFGIRHMALMTSRRDLAEKLEPTARRIQREAMHTAGRIISIELRTFRVAPP